MESFDSDISCLLSSGNMILGRGEDSIFCSRGAKERGLFEKGGINTSCKQYGLLGLWTNVGSICKNFFILSWKTPVSCLEYPSWRGISAFYEKMNLLKFRLYFSSSGIYHYRITSHRNIDLGEHKKCVSMF